MSSLHTGNQSDTVQPDVMSHEVEIARIMQTGTIWVAAIVVGAGLVLGPLLAAGWRPTQLPALALVPWWLGVAGAAGGLALLVWAACPVLAFGLEDAYAQKVFCIRVGIVTSLAGFALAGVTLFFAPVTGG
ncbi:MAG: hypothetical protein HY996_11555 [Micrococcales bacterium]|nr:hypothetical protein [Micrococcales bacterium]